MGPIIFWAIVAILCANLTAFWWMSEYRKRQEEWDRRIERWQIERRRRMDGEK